MDKVDAPDMIGILRTQPNDRTVIVVKSFTLLMSFGKLQSFLAPDTLYPLVIDLPAFNAEQFCNLAIPIPAILFGQPDQGQAQFLVTVFVRGFVLLTGTGNANNSTCASFRSSELLTGVDYGLT